ncbi:MAG: hypothetical protein FWF30_01750 [Coriobacteriia bacterium]|nr:hypothetical protein [Coriobacteriia bacterium]
MNAQDKENIEYLAKVMKDYGLSSARYKYKDGAGAAVEIRLEKGLEGKAGAQPAPALPAVAVVGTAALAANGAVSGPPAATLPLAAAAAASDAGAAGTGLGGPVLAQPLGGTSPHSDDLATEAVGTDAGGLDQAVDFNRLIEVTSPLVGVFYAAATPEAEPFVSIGSKVTRGTVLCIIETMKLMNEIVAEEDGEIVDICIKNGDIAEFGQVLFKMF